MSYREKLAWVCLGTTVVIFVPYFIHMISLFATGEPTGAAILRAFIAAVISQIVLCVVATVMISAGSGAIEPEDERDRMIDARAMKISYYIVATSIFLAIGALLAWSPLLVGQFLLCGFVVAEVVRYATQAVWYRLGA